MTNLRHFGVGSAPGDNYLCACEQTEGEQVDVPVQLVTKPSVQVVAQHDPDPRSQPAWSRKESGQSERA